MEWFKLSEKLPQKDKEVLVAIKDSNNDYVTVGEYMNAENFRVLGCLGTVGGTDYVSHKKIFAWAEYPEFPVF